MRGKDCGRHRDRLDFMAEMTGANDGNRAAAETSDVVDKGQSSFEA
jgi:hypothetical protein